MSEGSILKGIFFKDSPFYKDRSLMNEGSILVSLALKDQSLKIKKSIHTPKSPILRVWEVIFHMLILFDLNWNLLWGLSIWWSGSTFHPISNFLFMLNRPLLILTLDKINCLQIQCYAYKAVKRASTRRVNPFNR